MLFDKINKLMFMKTDIIEKQDEYLIYIDVPGVNKENIKVITDNDFLIVTAIREKETEKEYLSQERSFGEFTRKFYIGKNNDNPKSISAKITNGVLEIKISKVNESKKQSINID